MALGLFVVPAPAADEAAAFEPIPLTGEWRFSPLDEPQYGDPAFADSAWKIVKVPGKLSDQGVPLGNGWCRRDFTAPQESAGKDLVLEGIGLSGMGWVRVNGALVGWSDGWSRAAFLVPAGIVKPGRNVVAVRMVGSDGLERGAPLLRLPDEKTGEKSRLLMDYLVRSSEFDVAMPPLAEKTAKSIPVSVRLNMRDPANPLLDNAALTLAIEERAEDQGKPGTNTWREIFRKDARLEPGKDIAADFSLPLKDNAVYRVIARCLGADPLSRSLATCNILRPELPRMFADPRSRHLKDLDGNLVCLFHGPAPAYPAAARSGARPVVASLLSDMVWDDYYLPRNREDNFAARFCRDLPGGAVHVDASFRGLPLLALAELDRSVLASNPDVILISIGEHEHYFSPSVKDFEAALNAIADRLRSQTTATLVFVTPPPSLRADEIGAPYENAVRETAKRVNAPLVDSRKIFEKAAGGVESNYDRLAPNVVLHEAIAAELRRVLDSKAMAAALKRSEFDRSAALARGTASSNSLTLVADGKWPVSSLVSANVIVREVEGVRFHTHDAGPKLSEHNFSGGHPFGFGSIYEPPPFSSEDKPSPRPAAPDAASAPRVWLEQEVLIPADSGAVAMMLVFQSADLNRDAQGINYLHKHSWNHGVTWGDDSIEIGKGGPPEARVKEGALPAKGKIAVLRVDARELGLQGRLLTGAKFVVFGGPVLWGRTSLVAGDAQGGKAGERRSDWIRPGLLSETPGFPVSIGRGMEWQWQAAPGGSGAWGSRCHRAIDPSGEVRYGVQFRHAVPLAPGARLRQWVYIPQDEKPDRIAICVDGSSLFYWGRLMLYDESPNRLQPWMYSGPMPSPGSWAALEIDLATVFPSNGRTSLLQFLTQSGAALWGRTEILGVADGFKPPDGFLVEYPTGDYDVRMSVSSDRAGNQFFEGQQPRLVAHLNNASAQSASFKGTVRILDAYDRETAVLPFSRDVAPGTVDRVALACPELARGFYRLIVRDAAGKPVSERSLSMLPRHVNFRDKQVFIYSNSGYVWEQLRFFDVVGGKWCRSIAPEQETHRIESFDMTPIAVDRPGTEAIIQGYRNAVAGASRNRSSKHHVRYWFNISSDEMNLKWHNYERWSEVIKAVTVGLKQADPACFVSTPEINSIAMGAVDKLGENRTYDYLDIFFSTGCSLPVPPECINKYWSFDLESLDTIQEKYGRTWTLTGMQYSTGNIGRSWGISERHQAAYYARGDILRRVYGVDFISYFKFRESPNVNIYEVKDAINHADLTPKPAFVALCNVFAMMDGARYLGRLRLDRGAHAYLFERPEPRGLALVLWSTEPVPQKACLNLRSGSARVVDLYGKPGELPLCNGLAEIEYDGDLRIVEGVGKGIMDEKIFEPAPVRDARGLKLKTPTPVFAAIENHRIDSLNLGDSRRGGRGDFVVTAGASVPVKVNVYNLGPKPGSAKIRLAAPAGYEPAGGEASFDLAPGSAASRVFHLRAALDTRPGPGKFVVDGEFRAADGSGTIALDPFFSDVLTLSPLTALPLESPLPSGAGEAAATVKVAFHNASERPVDATVRLKAPFDWKLGNDSVPLKAVGAGERGVAEFKVLSARPQPFHRYAVAAFAESGGKTAGTESELDIACVMRAGARPDVDGDLREWGRSASVFSGERSNDYIYNRLEDILDRENYSSRLRAMWDEQFLYLALDVWDDHLCCEDTKHGLMWDLDAAEISFDLDADGRTDASFAISPTGRSYIAPEDPRSDRPPMMTGSKGMIEMETKTYLYPTPDRPAGYVAEMAIPWEWFDAGQLSSLKDKEKAGGSAGAAPLFQGAGKAVPREGLRIGINVFAVDEDPQAWSARPWKFDAGTQRLFLPFAFSGAGGIADAGAAVPGQKKGRRIYSRMPGDIAAFSVEGDAGFVTNSYYAGDAERFPSVSLSDPGRAKAGRLWFYGPGWIEYEFDVGGAKKTGEVQAVEVMAELASCYRPGNTHYAFPGNPARVAVSIGGVEIGSFDALGDPGVDGFLMRMRVTDSGVFLNGARISRVALKDILPGLAGKARVRFAVSGLDGNPGGLNVHGPAGTGVHDVNPSLSIY